MLKNIEQARRNSLYLLYDIASWNLIEQVRDLKKMLSSTKQKDNETDDPPGIDDDGDYDEDDIDNSEAEPQPPQSLSSSSAIIHFIARLEKFRPSVYLDQAGKPTIGYGHLIQPGESFPNGITKEEAEQLLAKDVRTAEQAIRDKVTVPLTQNQFDALTSLVYNIGAGNFQNSTLLQLLNQGDYESAADQFLVWDKIRDQYGKLVVSEGLLNRRDDEYDIFLYGTTEE